MAVKTDIELAAAATIIQNETTNGANTADRVGQLLNDIIENKVNKLDAPKIYRALISQLGPSDPTAIVLENTLGGTVVLTRTGSAGQYEMTLSGAFTLNKTFISPKSRFRQEGSDHREIMFERSSANVISILTSFGVIGGGSFSDSMLEDEPVEIYVYP